ncbi:hypothetical protein GCM10022243_29510 [Saccharothrix violaceirubra]|uniref:non-specific serine/threonine protein kinase n=1 Tax=Saccharothrix violaceirubra TaxID=413306 RepID=A0A7W7WWN6_9PSEU|nr:protein kinase [Saccharothrix violaceirubra]MBB4966574.1 serine/threonine-protein kinase [Saccharothrix violaceirubra]
MSEQFGPYRIEALLGRGGMGEVHRAFDTVNGRYVALKRLPVAMANDEDFRARFRREARLLSRLSAPHVVPINDFGEIDGRMYLDMALIEGRDLDKVLAEGRLSAARSVTVISQLAAALDAAHAAGLVHRDVKPSNVLLASVAGGDFVHLLDFGIARSTTGTTGLTATGAAIGTLDYMAPERFVTGEADVRSDVYALACLLYECLTGAKPFPGGSMPSLIHAHLNVPPPAPTLKAADLPPAFDHVVATGMAKEPEARYQTPGALAAAAREALEATRVTTPRPTRLDTPPTPTRVEPPQPPTRVETPQPPTRVEPPQHPPTLFDVAPRPNPTTAPPFRHQPPPYTPNTSTPPFPVPTMPPADTGGSRKLAVVAAVTGVVAVGLAVALVVNLTGAPADTATSGTKTITTTTTTSETTTETTTTTSDEPTTTTSTTTTTTTTTTPALPDPEVKGTVDWYSCSEADVPSEPSDIPAVFTVTNDYEGNGLPILVFWIDQYGEWQHWFDVEPGQTMRQETYIGHRWALKYDSCIAVFSGPGEIYVS